MKHTIFAVFVCLICSTFQITAQARQSGTQDEKQQERAKTNTPKQFTKPVFRGLSVHYDIASPIMGLIYGKIDNYEIQFDVNLYRRIYPTLEIGFSSVDKTLSTGTRYRTNAPFFRIGLNYGLLKPFKNDGSIRNVKSYPFIGLRYCFSPMNYQISDLVISDPYWGTSETVGFSESLIYSGWIDIVGGVRIDIYKGLTMGWSVRFKTGLHTTAPDKSYLWYVPGYGKSSSSSFAFSYTIGYTFFTKEKNNKKDIKQ